MDHAGTSSFPPEALLAWNQQLTELRGLIEAVPARLRQVRPAPGSWSVQEIVGHLIDSALNNLQRLYRLQTEESISLPGYDAETWVRAGHYQDADWEELASLWWLLNRQLLRVAARLPAESFERVWHKPGADTPLPLRHIVEDYFRHLAHHREHLIERQAEAERAVG